MDQAEPYPDKGPPEQRGADQRGAGQQGPLQRQRRPERRRHRESVRPDEFLPCQPRPISLVHPVIVGYDGSASARNALAYAAGLARRLDRPLLMVYVTSPGVYCEPLTGQVVGVPRDADALERWLLAELDQVTGCAEIDVHVRTRRGSPARELAAAADPASPRPEHPQTTQNAGRSARLTREQPPADPP